MYGSTPLCTWVDGLTVFEGDLIAAGSFTLAGGTTAYNVARWDDTVWLNMGSGIVSDGVQIDPVTCLAVHDNRLFAGGYFTNYDGNSGAGYTAEWDGASWNRVCGVSPYYSTGCLNEHVNTLISHSNLLYAGGHFTGRAAAWDGSGWSTLVVNQAPLEFLSGDVRAFAVYGGKLVVGGNPNYVIEEGIYYSGLAFWNGQSFETFGESSWFWGRVDALTVYEGKLIATGGYYTDYPNYGSYHAGVAAWDGTSWTVLGGEFDNQVYELTVHNGRLIAGGNFEAIGGVYANYVVQWDGTQWLPLGSGTNGMVWALASWEGKLIVGGRFTSAGGQPVNYIAQWTKAKTITIRDAHNDSLTNVQFDLIRVANNRPEYTEDTLGSFVTDDQGRLPMTMIGDTAFTVALNEGDAVLRIGDSIKIARQMYSEPALRHHAVLGTKYSIHLDNGDFTDDGQLFFDTIRA